jgi:hypothetical protein
MWKSEKFRPPAYMLSKRSRAASSTSRSGASATTVDTLAAEDLGVGQLLQGGAGGRIRDA